MLRTLRQPEHVQNQRHFAVSHDGRSGIDADAFQVLAERLDHNLFGVVDFVDHQPELPPIGFEHNDVHAAHVELPRRPEPDAVERRGLRTFSSRFK
jgi:hypothetical protein